MKKLFLLMAIVVAALGAEGRAQVNVLTQHNDNGRTGANLQETTLNTSNVNAARFGKLFSRDVNSKVWAQPLYVSGVTIPNKGARNVIYTVTEVNTMYCYDADDPAATAPYWRVSLLPAGHVFLASQPTPVIDAASKTIYYVSKTRNSTTSKTAFFLYALDITTGANRPNSPMLIEGSVAGTGLGSTNGRLPFLASTQKSRPALLLHNGVVYATFGASVAEYAAGSIWNGWIIGYDAATLAQRAIWAVSPNSNGGGIWQSGQGPSIDPEGNMYVMTSNGNNAPSSFSAKDGGIDYGDSFVKLSTANNTLKVTDWFTPYNQDYMERADQDLGSAGPIPIPDTNLLIGGGKTGYLYLINRSNMGHWQAGSNSQIVQTWQAFNGHLHGSPIYWKSPASGAQIYVWSEDDYLKAYRLINGYFQTTPASMSTVAAPPGMPGGILSISANGDAAGSGIVWALLPFDGDANGDDVPGILRAFDANDVTRELWNSKQIPARDDMSAGVKLNLAKFAAPTIANGKVYVPTFADKLNTAGGAKIHVYGLLPAAPTPAAPTGLTATAGIGSVSLRWTSSSGAASYTLRRSTTSGGPYTIVARNITTNSFLDTAVTNSTPYFYVVFAEAAAGQNTNPNISGNSNQATATPFAPAAGSVLSVNFQGGNANFGTPAALASTESAGVIAAPNWNNAPGATGALAALKANGGGATSAGVSWGPNDPGVAGATASTSQTATDANSRMMKGFINGYGGATKLTVSDLPSVFATQGYDVYVYVDGDNYTATRTGTYAIAGATRSVTDAKGATFLGRFSEGANGSVGNYVVFRDMAVTDFVLTATPGASTDATPRAPLNGVQIVLHQNGGAVVPPPTLQVPAAPQNLSAAPGNAQVVLRWDAATGATRYAVKRATTAGGPYTALADVTANNFTDTNVVNNTAYFYVVTAANSAGESPNSNEATAKPFVSGSGSIISVNFVGSAGTTAAPAPMGAGETAGVITSRQASNWNNAAGATGTLSGLRDNIGAASGASVTWSAYSTSSTAIADVPGNARMMKGHLKSSDTSTTTVTVSNLPPAFTTPGYDVFVYFDGVNSSGRRVASYAIGGTTILGTDAAATDFNGTFVQSSGTVAGNYVLFPNVAGSGFTLSTTPVSSTDNSKRTLVSGIEIVSHVLTNLPPKIKITSPAPDSAARALPAAVEGTAGDNSGRGLDRVDVVISRDVVETAATAPRHGDEAHHEYWSGAEWLSEPTSLPAALNADGSWVMTRMPTGTNVSDNVYSFKATAYDKAGSSTDDLSSITIDTVAPLVTISSPLANSVRATLPGAGGTCSDASSGIARVTFALRRFSDNRNWNGSLWTSAAESVNAAISGNTWSVTASQLPSGTNLKDGKYAVKATAFDRAGNSFFAENTITIDTGPLVTVSTPVHNSILASFTSAAGTVVPTSGRTLARLDIYLRRSDMKYWTGTTWTSTVTALVPTLSGNSWSKMSGWPAPGTNADTQMIEGSYVVYGYAFDNTNNRNDIAAQSAFKIDRTPPSVTITAPAAGATVSSVQATGTATDKNGLKGVSLYLLRVTDSKWWTGTAWGTSAIALPATVSGTGWSKSAGWPAPGSDTATQLVPGSYTLMANALDRAGNSLPNHVRSTFSVSTVAARSTVSSVQLSSASASVVGGVVLSFTGPLDPTTAGEAARYKATVNGTAVAISGVAYSAATNSVTLRLPTGSFRAGDMIGITWNGVRDSAGNALSGSATMRAG